MNALILRTTARMIQELDQMLHKTSNKNILGLKVRKRRDPHISVLSQAFQRQLDNFGECLSVLIFLLDLVAKNLNSIEEYHNGFRILDILAPCLRQLEISGDLLLLVCQESIVEVVRRQSRTRIFFL